MLASLAAPSNVDMTPNSDTRRQEIIKRVASGIDTARAQVVDLSATFDGPQPVQYVLTLAMANSPVDPKIQYAFYAGKNSPQHGNSLMNGYMTVNKPEIVTMNFLEALKKEMKTPFEAVVNFGQNGNIQVKGQTERTQKYAELLQKHQLAQTCQEEIAQSNMYQDACHKLVVIAHAPDSIKASVSYKEVSPAVRGMFYQAYKLLEHWGFWYTEVNPMKTVPDGKLEIDTQISYLEKTISLALASRLGDVRVRNAPIPRVLPQALAIYTPFSATERVYNQYTRHQFQRKLNIRKITFPMEQRRSLDGK